MRKANKAWSACCVTGLEGSTLIGRVLQKEPSGSGRGWKTRRKVGRLVRKPLKNCFNGRY